MKDRFAEVYEQVNQEYLACFGSIYLLGIIGALIFDLQNENAYNALVLIIAIIIFPLGCYIVFFGIPFSVYVVYLGIRKLRPTDKKKHTSFTSYVQEKVINQGELKNDLIFDNNKPLNISPIDFLKWLTFSLFYLITTTYSFYRLIVASDNEPVPLIQVVGLIGMIAISVQFFFSSLDTKLSIYSSGWFIKDIRTSETTRLGPKFIISFKERISSWEFIITSGFSGLIWIQEFLRTNDFWLFLNNNSSEIGTAFILFSALLFEGMFIYWNFTKNKAEKHNILNSIMTTLDNIQ